MKILSLSITQTICLTVMLLCITLCAQHIQVALIDTTLHSIEQYHTLIRTGALMQIAIKHIAPSKYLTQQAGQSDAYMVILDKGILTHPNAYYTKLVHQQLRSLAPKPLIILLPHDVIALEEEPEEISEKIAQFFDCSEDNVLDAFDEFILKQREFKPLYATLNESANNRIISKFPTLEDVTLLPKASCSSVLTANMPLALLIKRNERPFIAISSLATWMFPDVDEQQSINPLNMRVRKELLKGAIETVAELKAAIIKKPVTVFAEAVEQLVKEITGDLSHDIMCKLYKEKNHSFNWAYNGSALGCLHLDLNESALRGNMQLLAQADLDAYVLEIPMNSFEPSERNKLFSRLTEFRKTYITTHALCRHTPKMFIGIDLASLIGWQTLTNGPIDIYGTCYEHFPAPLDYEGFWKPIVIKTIEQLVAQWKADKNQVPLDGIILTMPNDSVPLNMLDFSNTVWHEFVATLPQDQQENLLSLTTEERIRYIFESNLLTIYQEYLTHKATTLGQTLAADMRALLNDAILGIRINNCNNWFYKGLLRGISSAEQPVVLISNDTLHYMHKDWYTTNGIFALHHVNVPLAKFNNDTDIELVNELLKHHDGVCYNKLSNLGQPYNKNSNNETTSTDAQKIVKIINKQIRK